MGELIGLQNRSVALVWGLGMSAVLTAACDQSTPDPVQPPFEVKGDVEGLLLVWFDDEGPHTANRRADIPERSRKRVRVESLATAPDERLGPEHVYVADLRREVNGAYPVRQVPRARFERWVAQAAGVPDGDPAATPGADRDVIIYMADWCGVCRSAARFLRSRDVPFVEKDIEKDGAARQEMQRKTKRAGIVARGVPVLDLWGTILNGFDRARVARVLESRAASATR